ncbi:hypothetical protein B0T17DRAFT_541541 [Bombardia bombarda]|uniref:FAD-binding PCMH-type domain-containing protein n=1 Tax=Bombardia bombarda TaxID=252184 RepID=A0AA39WH32_9PEZI|nr:hypothetical protein B0T17DRAFT_541541 [Bombardia bombarda]
MRNTSTYTFENRDYWSSTEIRDPGCVFMPDSADKVAAAVSLFVKNECKFAIKGGGHSAIPQAANIDDGVLMAMKNMNKINIDFGNNRVRVEPGLTMGSIYAALDPHNLTAMVGRFENVGLGLIVGAGVSYRVNQEGFAIDNVLNYELVLANGTIVHANANQRSDLFRALKGGNNNFGVVVAVTLKTIKYDGKIFAGIVYHPESSLSAFSDLVYDYHTVQAVKDPLTHCLPQYGYNGTTNTTVAITTVVYNANVDRLPPIMRGWETTPYTSSTVRKRTYHELSFESNEGYPDRDVQEQRVFTVYADKKLYKDVWLAYRKWLEGYRHIPSLYGLHVVMPITPRAVQEGIKKGHNSLGLEDNGGKVLGILYFGLTISNIEDTPLVLPAHTAFVESMKRLAASRGLLHRYMMLTYSGWDQNVIEGYGPDNVARLLAVQAKYDPTHVFQRLVPGGQKLPGICAVNGWGSGTVVGRDGKLLGVEA